MTERDTSGQNLRALSEELSTLVENHVQLDAAFNEQIGVVIADTETSAVKLIRQVRALNDATTALMSFLDSSQGSAQELESKIVGGAASIAAIGTFVEEFPALLRGEVNTVNQRAIRQIGDLGAFMKVIEEIARETKFLALNTGIMAASAGTAGLGFAAVAREVRKLSDRAEVAVRRVDQGLADAMGSMREGMKLSQVDAQIEKARGIVESIHSLQGGYEDIRLYYRNLFAAVTEHHTKLAREMGEILGQIQLQDVVRQRLERVMAGMARGNAVLEQLPPSMDGGVPALVELGEQLLGVLRDYVTEEQLHATASSAVDSDGLPAVQLF